MWSFVDFLKSTGRALSTPWQGYARGLFPQVLLKWKARQTNIVRLILVTSYITHALALPMVCSGSCKISAKTSMVYAPQGYKAHRTAPSWV